MTSRFAKIFSAVAVSTACALSAGATIAPVTSEADAPANREADARALADARNYRPLDTLRSAGGYFFDRQNQITMAAASAGLLYSFTLDERAREAFRHQHRLLGYEHVGNDYLGTGLPGAVFGGGFWLVGNYFDSSKTIHSGQAQLEAVVLTSIATTGLKYAIDRQRPNGDHFSFPSGHTSTVFATAMVIHEFYGWKIGVPFFLIGVATASGRLNDDRHWFSDTVGGAALGIFVAHAVARAHLEQLEKARNPTLADGRVSWRLSPMLLSDGGGLVLSVSTP